MKVITFIPCRYESTRFPGKPLALIAGKPMVEHVYQRAMSCAEVSDVFVATDDERIFQCVRDFGGKAVMTKKEHPTGTDRISEASQKMSLNEDDLIVNVQGDQPLFHPSTISDLIAPLKEDPNIPMSTLKYRITDETEIDNPNHVKVVTDKEGFALFFSRSPIPFFRNSRSHMVYYKHLGFYAYRKDFLTKFGSLPVGELESSEKLEQLRALEYGFKIRVVETPFDSIEVDTPADIKRVEELMAQT
ncbi:MAG: 3-deoxy-manno-octulosonate cytidylyltransferase [Deltaproteobacteria bacterium]|nr:MAG: 3-deoxy-manno-octulosonate cytidylyltransferase [Deltaproteobacteria bacterium]